MSERPTRDSIAGVVNYRFPRDHHIPQDEHRLMLNETADDVLALFQPHLDALERGHEADAVLIAFERERIDALERRAAEAERERDDQVMLAWSLAKNVAARDRMIAELRGMFQEIKDWATHEESVAIASKALALTPDSLRAEGDAERAVIEAVGCCIQFWEKEMSDSSGVQFVAAFDHLRRSYAALAAARKEAR